MRKKNKLLILVSLFFILFFNDFQIFAMGIFPPPENPPWERKPPPWVDPTPDDPAPPAAPEPISLALIGMGASGVVGYYLGKKKNK
ncbi:MAG: hypothetical protein JW927_22545 [Deltaproteobacteria bacterium]|nr:hypothetical protein [Deltaproteobacteria bacterium]